ncbi:MAG: DNA/RNA nuclease SfsA [Deltaproteobacteria bacterium]|nr:DNA/RNA nuclease SfsA [Deltaproteobacteria bacterium]
MDPEQEGLPLLTPAPDSGHYLAVMCLDAPVELAIGALGARPFPAGDLVYVGSAQRQLAARLARHRRRGDKRLRWHVDYLREAARWVEGRLLAGATGPECGLADAVAALPGARRVVPGFGASDCGCAGHLVHVPEGAALPGLLDPAEGVPATLVARRHRFGVDARLASGEVVAAYLPNTARLIGVLSPGCALLLQPNADPARKTRFTATRARVDGQWVALAASAAEDLLAAWLAAGHPLAADLGPAVAVAREVRLDRHRLDFRVTLGDGRRAWLEVKSTSVADGDDALLSRTPSTRGAAHLALLGDLVAAGELAVAAFVVQRRARRLLVEAGADPGWLAAVRAAIARGVRVVAFESRVTPAEAWLRGPIPVVDRAS